MAHWAVHWLSEIEEELGNAQGRPRRCPTPPACSPGGQSSLTMRCIGWYSPCRKTTCPRELMARWAVSEPQKGLFPPFHGDSGAVLLCTEPLLLAVPSFQLLPMPVNLLCCRSTAPLVRGPELKIWLRFCSLYGNFRLKSVSCVLGSVCLYVHLQAGFFPPFFVIFFSFYSLMKLLRKCSSAVSKSHETGGASRLWLFPLGC